MKNIILFIFIVLLFFHFTAYSQGINLNPYAALQTEEKENITALAFTKDGRLIISGDEEGYIHGWNMEGKAEFLKIKMDREIIFLAFLPNDNQFLAADKNGKIGIYSITNGMNIKTLESKYKPVKISFDYFNQKLAIMNINEEIEIFDLKSELPEGKIDADDKTDNILLMDFNISGSQLYAINDDGNVFCWDPGKKKIIRELKLLSGEMHGSKALIHSAAGNRSSNMFVIGLEEVAMPKGGIRTGKDLLRENIIVVYDWNSGFELKRIKFNSPVIKCVPGPGDDYISIANDDNNNIDLIDLKRGEIISTVTTNEKPQVITVSEGNNFLASGFKNGKITIWSLDYKGAVSITQTKITQLNTEKEQKKDYSAKNIKRWAVIVGISKYKYAEKGITPLQYADADAKVFYDFLKSPQGGGFQENNMMLLTNENATYQNIRKGINSFLGKAVEEDIVIIYFAGHGAPDPNNPKNLFFITYDTDPEEMSSTGYLMDDLKNATNRFIKARNVLIFSDACHSAGVSGQYATRGQTSDAIINRYLLELAASESSSLIFTASEVNEYSKESARWGSGHGVFTYCLLEGLRGAADENNDGIITLGEIIDYTQVQVRRETQSQQHPTVAATRFDRNLPMSVIKGGMGK
jgi:uncharacterized caspase-like protein